MRASSVPNTSTNASASASRPTARDCPSPASIARLARPIATTAPAPSSAAHCDACGDDVVVADHAIDEADLQRFIGADLPSAPDQFLGAGGPDEARQALGATGTRDDAEQDLGLTESRPLTGDAQIARHRELEAAAQRIAANRGDDRTRDRVDRVERGAEPVGDATRGRLVAELVDVGAGRERAVAPGDHNGFHRRVSGDLGRGRADRREHRLRQRVHRRPVELEKGNAVLVARGQYVVVGHGAGHYPAAENGPVRGNSTSPPTGT